jgi:long-chain acyl-CoA synthetase
MGLKAIGFQLGEIACVLAETRPEWVYVDLGILGAGGISGGIDPAEEPEPLGQVLDLAGCRVLFVENDEQLDKVLLVRDRCPALQRIVIFDMKGLRDFADPMPATGRRASPPLAPISRRCCCARTAAWQPSDGC